MINKKKEFVLNTTVSVAKTGRRYREPKGLFEEFSAIWNASKGTEIVSIYSMTQAEKKET